MTLALSDVELAAVTSVWVAAGRELTAAFGGTSMLPTIEPGQRVVLRCGTEPAVGDVAAYLLRDQVVVHRVVARSEDGSWFLAWGDHNALPDPPFGRDRLIGTLTSVERGGALISIPAAPLSRRRRVVLGLVAKPSAPIASVERRMRFIYRVRGIVGQPFRVLVSKLMKRLVHRPA